MRDPNGGLTRSIANFACGEARTVADDEVSDIIKMGFIDTAGVILAGKNQPVVDVMRRFIHRHGARPSDATILFGSEKMASRDAALINSTAGHSLDYDDVAFCGHPSVVLVPALLAEGERLGSSGQDLIDAYLIGYEVWAELFYREPDLLHDKGWHSTGVLGAVSAAAAISALRKVGVDQCINALGMAASMASGIVANFGSEAKPVHAGLASSSAIDAVDLASFGIKTSPDAVEHRAGLLAAVSPKGAVDLTSPAVELGRNLRIRQMRLTFKNYPMCFATHRVIDATLGLARTGRINPAELKCAHVHLGAAQAAMLRNHRPCTGVEAKFSLEFAVAASLVAHKIGLAEVQDDFVLRPEVRSLFEKLHVTLRNTSRADQPSLAESDRVIIELIDGSMLDSGEVRYALGDAFNPMDFVHLKRKFDECARSVGEYDRTGLFASLRHLEDIKNIRDINLGASTPLERMEVI